MKKSTYLTILLLIWVNLWNIKPFGGNMTADYTQIMLLMYLAFGVSIYSNSRIKFRVNKYKPMKWIFVGIFLSMISVYMYYGQSITQSLVAYRYIYFLASIILFFKISFKPGDILKGIHTFSVLLAIMYFIKLSLPQLFYFSPQFLEMQENGNYTMGMGGFALITIPLFMRLQNLRNKFVAKEMYWALFYLAILFFMQNRSVLFASLLITAYQIFKIKTQYKPAIIILCVGLFVYFGADVINDLMFETEEQLADDEYNRNLALPYFITVTTQDWFTAIFGCGFISAHTSPIMQTLMDAGIYNSDVGLVGFWNHYGIIPVIAILYLFISTLRTKEMPLFMKMLALLHLSCVLTIEYYGNYVSMSRFLFFYYLYFYYMNEIKMKKMRLKLAR